MKATNEKIISGSKFQSKNGILAIKDGIKTSNTQAKSVEKTLIDLGYDTWFTHFME